MSESTATRHFTIIASKINCKFKISQNVLTFFFGDSEIDSIKNCNFLSGRNKNRLIFSC